MAKQTKPEARRVKRSDLVAPRTRRSRRLSILVSRQWQRTWQPIRKFFSRSFDLPKPQGRAGRILGKRIRAPKYFREALVELKKVEWPDRRQTWRLTWAVFAFSAFFAIFTALADFGLSKAVERILLK